MIVIERTHNLIQARVMVSFLQAHGVNALLLDAETSTMIPIAPLGVRIAVPNDEEHQARRILSEWEQSHMGDDNE